MKRKILRSPVEGNLPREKIREAVKMVKEKREMIDAVEVLRECPFCGHKRISVRKDVTPTKYHGDRITWWVWCEYCTCSAQVPGATREGVIQQWNTRHESQTDLGLLSADVENKDQKRATPQKQEREGKSCKTCTHDLCGWTGQDVTEPCEYYYKPAREQGRERTGIDEMNDAKDRYAERQRQRPARVSVLKNRLREAAGELMDMFICPYAWNIYQRSAFCEVVSAPCIKTKRMVCWLAYLQAKDGSNNDS